MILDFFRPKKKTERDYYRALLSVCDKIGMIIATFFKVDKPSTLKEVEKSLRNYSKTLNPWSKKIAKQVIEDVNTRNLNSWSAVSNRMSEIFVEGYKNGDGAFKVAKKLQNDQVELIKTLPLKAAERMQDLSREYLATGVRHEVLAKRVQQTTNLVKFRAACIARTEIAKAQSALTEARCKSVGITHYRWRTMGDEIVRDLHEHLDGKVFSYDHPPLVGREGRHGPGEFPNCRCYAEPIIEEATIYGNAKNSKIHK